MAGNVQGVTEVKIDKLQAPPPPVQARVEYYVIKKGDTLSAIAKQFYGKANDYPRIFEANREVIRNADLSSPLNKVGYPWTEGKGGKTASGGFRLRAEQFLN